ncbi:hypothetical protein [Paenibacillus xylanexedens]|uniref:hypothetical protein n=1 Tax=Paenibacillus xylanexedens TaxID=528191 RepID=UPI003D07A00F
MSTWHDENVILNKELIEEIKNHFTVSSISNEYTMKIFQENDQQRFKYINKLSLVNLSINNIENREGITLTTDSKGKVFEVTGTNQRFKTTSLILVALMLGYNFIDATDVISSNQIQTQVGKLTSTLFSKNETKVLFEINNEEHHYVFEKTESEINIRFNEWVTTISLHETEFDSAYKTFISFISPMNIAEPQFISKGRNFVGNVHKEIREEFLNTLKSIESRLSEVVIKALNTTSEKNRIKTEAEVTSHLVYVKKAVQILNKIYIPLNVIYFMQHQIIPEMYNNFTVGFLRKSIIKNEISLVDLREKYKKYEISKLDASEKIVSIIEIINKSAEDLPMKFSINGIKQQIQLFEVEWDELTPESNLGLSNVYPGDFQGRIVPFNVSSTFFSNISVTTVQNYINTMEILSSIHSKIIDLKRVIMFYKEELFANVEYLNINGKYISTTLNEIKEIEKDKKDQEKILALLDYVDISSEEELLKDIFEKFYKHEQFILSQHLFKCLSKIDLDYENSDKENLMKDIIMYEQELIKSKQMGKNVLLFPKKFQDTKEMSKILQDLRAVYNYLSLDSLIEKKEKVSVVKASKETGLHASVIKLFNNYMAKRCKYYFEVITQNNIRKIPLIDYDYEEKEFDIGTTKVSTREGISGGTDSAMTVVSFASKSSLSKFGIILLVDEWGDVGEGLAKKTYETLEEVDCFGMGIFVKVDHEKDKISINSIM